MKRRALAAYLLAAAFIASPAWGQGEKEKCLKVAQAKLAACQQKLPSNVTPKDKDKPTAKEKAAMLKYTKASNACNEAGKTDALACNK